MSTPTQVPQFPDMPLLAALARWFLMVTEDRPEFWANGANCWYAMHVRDVVVRELAAGAELTLGQVSFLAAADAEMATKSALIVPGLELDGLLEQVPPEHYARLYAGR